MKDSDAPTSTPKASSPRPVRTYRRPFVKALLAALIGFGAAAGAGWYAWNLRGERAELTSQLDKRVWEAEACAKELGPLKEQAAELNRKVAACESGRASDKNRHADFEKLLGELQENLSASRAELEELRKQRAQAEKRVAAFRELTDKFRQMVDAGKLEVTVREGRMFVNLPAEVLFGSGRAELSTKGQMALMEVAVVLRQFTDRRFMVAGHTDNRPVGGGQYASNWELSTARAVTVTKFLIDAGMKPQNLVAAGYGEFAPVADNASKTGRQKNRRIEIVLLPNIEELPAMPEMGDAGSK